MRSPWSRSASRTAWSAPAPAIRWWSAWAKARISSPRTRSRSPGPPTASPIWKREAKTVQTSGVAAELGPYSHFMQKEIFEQPRAVGDTLAGIEGITPELFQDPRGKALRGVKSVLILACGTSYYSGLTAKYWIESLARVPVQVEVASEYRYRDSVPDANTLVVLVSQSGETADTLAALKHARSLGQKKTLVICNVASSAMMRETRLKFLTHAGVEIGVASTKAFPTQL